MVRRFFLILFHPPIMDGPHALHQSGCLHFNLAVSHLKLALVDAQVERRKVLGWTSMFPLPTVMAMAISSNWLFHWDYIYT